MGEPPGQEHPDRPGGSSLAALPKDSVARGWRVGPRRASHSRQSNRTLIKVSARPACHSAGTLAFPGPARRHPYAASVKPAGERQRVLTTCGLPSASRLRIHGFHECRCTRSCDRRSVLFVHVSDPAGLSDKAATIPGALLLQEHKLFRLLLRLY